MNVKVESLSGILLDFAVAKILYGHRFSDTEDLLSVARKQQYSSQWAQGGPIMDKEQILIVKWDKGTGLYFAQNFKPYESWAYGSGETQLIAAMRCFVSLKLGDEIELPDQLCNFIV